jgi:Rrf2 family protein
MRIGEGVEAGMHCAFLLAVIPEDAVLPAKTMAEFHGVSESYLLKHLRALASAGILEAVPGPKGGYRLARQPEKITMYDIVAAIEGSEPAFRCTEIRQRGPCPGPPSAYTSPCAINRAMLRAEDAWRESLRQETIAGLVRELTPKSDAASAQCAIDWITERLRRS